VTKIATLLGVLRTTVSKIMLAYTNHVKTTLAKRNSVQKSTPTEIDNHTLRGTVSKKTPQNYCCRGDSGIEYVFILKTVSTKIDVQHELHKSKIHGRAAIAKPITESNVQMHKQWCQDHKTWISSNWKHTCDIIRRVVLYAVFTSGRVYVSRTPNEA
jgi:hypothetical protein